jgi:hypothetical protein
VSRVALSDADAPVVDPTWDHRVTIIRHDAGGTANHREEAT